MPKVHVVDRLFGIWLRPLLRIIEVRVLGNYIQAIFIDVGHRGHGLRQRVHLLHVIIPPDGKEAERRDNIPRDDFPVIFCRLTIGIASWR